MVGSVQGFARQGLWLWGFSVTTNDRIGIIFDMDGVLVDSAESHLQSWQVLAEENGTSVTSEQVAASFGQQNRDIVPTLFGPVSDARLTELANRKEQIYRDLVREAPPIAEGAVSLVRSLHEAGAALAIGSSAPRDNIDLVLSAMGVSECIAVIVSGDDVTRGKPDPQVFAMTIEQLGVPARRCVVVEDAPVGVQAGKAAGAKCVAVLMHHPAEAFQRADLVVARLVDLSRESLDSLARR